MLFNRYDFKATWQWLYAARKSLVVNFLALVALFVVLASVGADLYFPFEKHPTIQDVWGATSINKGSVVTDKAGLRLLILNADGELLSYDSVDVNEAEPYIFDDALECNDKLYVLKTYRHQNAFVSGQKIVRYNTLGIPEETIFAVDCSKDNLEANDRPILDIYKGNGNDSIRLLMYNAKRQQVEVYLLQDKKTHLLWQCSYTGGLPMCYDYDLETDRVVISDYYGGVYLCSATGQSVRMPLEGVVYYVGFQSGDLLYARRGDNTLWRYYDQKSRPLLTLAPEKHISIICNDEQNFYISANEDEDYIWDGERVQITQPIPYSYSLYLKMYVYYVALVYLLGWLFYFFYQSLGIWGVGRGIYKYLTPIVLIALMACPIHFLLENSLAKLMQQESNKMQYYLRIPFTDGRSEELGAILEKYNRLDKSKLDLTAVMNNKVPVASLPLTTSEQQTIKDLREAANYIASAYVIDSKANLNVNDPYLMSNQDGTNVVLASGDNWHTLFNAEAAEYQVADSSEVLVSPYDDPDGSGLAITRVLVGPQSGQVEGALKTYANINYFKHTEGIFIFTILAKLALYGAVIYLLVQEFVHAWHNFWRYRKRKRYLVTIKEFFYAREIRLFNVILAEADAVLLVLIVKNLLEEAQLENTLFYISGLLFLKGLGKMLGMACFDWLRKHQPMRTLVLGCSLGIILCYIGMYYAVSAHNYGNIAMLRTLVAFFCGFIFQGLNVLPVFLYNDNFRAETIANIDFGMMAGSVIGPLFLGYIGENFGYSNIYLLLVGISVGGFFVNACCFSKNVYYVENTTNMLPTTTRTIGKFFTSPAMVSLCLLFFLPLGFACNYTGFIFPLMASRDLGISDFSINILVVLGTALTYWLRPTVDIVESRIDFWLECILGVVFCGLGYMALTINKTASFIVLMLVLVSFASKFDNSFFLVMRMVRKRNLFPITYINLYMAICALISAGTVYILGYLMERSYQLAFASVAVICLCGVSMFTISSYNTVMKNKEKIN